MTDLGRTRFLRRIGGFEGLTDADLSLLAHHVGQQRFSSGTVLAREGEATDRVFQLVAGIIQLRQGEPAGDHASTSVLTGGELIGERGFRTGRPERVSAVALSEVEVLSLARRDLEQLLGEHPAIAVALWQALSARLEDQSHRIATVEPERRGRILAVVGLEAQVGRTTVAINLCTAIAQLTHSRVILLDPNLGAATIPRVLGISADADYVDAFLRGAVPDPERMTWMTKGGFSTVLPPRRKANALSEAHLTAAFHALARSFDYVVVDSSSPRAGLNRTVLQAADRILLVNRNSESKPDADRTQFERSVLGPQGIQPDRLICAHNLLRSDSPAMPGKDSVILPYAGELLGACGQRHGIALMEAPRGDFSMAIQELARRLIFDHRLRISIPPRRWTPAEHEQATGRLQQFLEVRFNEVALEPTVALDAEEAPLGVGAWATQAVLSEHLAETVGFLGTLKGELAVPYLSFEINGRPNLI